MEKMEALLYDLSETYQFPDKFEEMLAWARSIGGDPNRMLNVGVIVHEDDGWRLHTRQHAHDENGHCYVDKRVNLIATEAVSYRLGETPNWPAWIGEVVELTRMPGEHVVEILHHAEYLKINLASRLKPIEVDA